MNQLSQAEYLHWLDTLPQVIQLRTLEDRLRDIERKMDILSKNVSIIIINMERLDELILGES